jgi:hypothetical protein
MLSTKLPLFQSKQGLNLSSQHDLVQMREELRDGPLRFAPTRPERTVQDQILKMSDLEQACFEGLIDAWDAKYPTLSIPDDLVLRYVRNSPSGRPYDRRAIWKLMVLLRSSPLLVSQLTLSVSCMAEHLRTKTIFPLPELQTKDGIEVLYMKPERYSPSLTPTRIVIDTLAYCINAMLERETACRNGIAFMANMDGWTMNDYGTDYCMKVRSMPTTQLLRPAVVRTHFASLPITLPHKVYENASRATNPSHCHSVPDCESATMVS